MEVPAHSSVSPVAASAAIGVGLGALVIVGVLVAAGSPFVWVVPIAVAAGLAVAAARPSPTVRLAVVLGLQVFQLGGDVGLDVGEVLAGLALVGYIAHWYVSAWSTGRPVVTSLFDAAALAWGTVGLVVAAVLGLLFGPDAYDFRADLIATLPFLLYLPVKDACARSSRNVLVVAAVLIGFGLYATVQNALKLHGVITGATVWYEVADARFVIGETSITAGFLLALSALSFSRGRWWFRLALLCLSGALVGGLLMTKSRGFWISATVGLIVVGLAAPGGVRRRLVAYGTAGILLSGGFAALFFGDQLVLLVLGTVNRLLSISTAASGVSLVNRFEESAAAWKMIRANPILGYGWGVQVKHYSVIGGGTRWWAFLHNGYLALWLKTGLWGLGLMMTVWWGAIVRGVRSARVQTLDRASRAVGLAAGGTIAAFSLAAITSNPFSILDQMFVVTVLLGLAHGVADRARQSADAAPSS